MSGFIGDLLEGIAGFFTDIWVLRRQRSSRNRNENAWSKDAADIVLFDARALLLAVVVLAVAAGLYFALELPLWISLVPIVAGGVYLGYRWFALVRA